MLLLLRMHVYSKNEAKGMAIINLTNKTQPPSSQHAQRLLVLLYNLLLTIHHVMAMMIDPVTIGDFRELTTLLSNYLGTYIKDSGIGGVGRGTKCGE